MNDNLTSRPKSRLVGLAMALAVLSTSYLHAQGPAEHVVLVSVDGFRPDFYLDPGWPAPMIQQMAREGVSAERVRSVFPSVTYPAHTTIITGALPARHGVVYNNPFEPAGQTGRWYWEFEAIKVPTLWQAVRARGGTSAVVSWPVTVGAPIDWLLPEVWSLEPNSDRLAPMRENTRPPELWAEIEREATGRLVLRNYSSAYLNRDDRTGAAAAYILETYKPTLLAFHLIGTDHFQHESGRESDIARRSVSAADRAISGLVEAAHRAGIADSTAFIVTGDHGFVDIHTELAPNVWLAEAGLMDRAADRGDWRATFHAAGGGALLRTRRPDDVKAVEKVREILLAQPASVRRLFRLVESDELEEIGADPESRLGIAAPLGVVIGARASGDPIGPARGGTHGYFPTDFPEIYTGFVGWGAGFRAGVVIHEMGLQDVAPVVSDLLGLDFTPPDGVRLPGIIAK